MEPKSIIVNFTYGVDRVQIIVGVRAISVYLFDDRTNRFEHAKYEPGNYASTILDAYYEMRETPEWLGFLARAQIISPRLLPGYDQGE